MLDGWSKITDTFACKSKNTMSSNKPSSFREILSNLWRNCFGGDSAPSTPPAPAPEPEKPSCFALGIAKSIKEEPEKWESIGWESYNAPDLCIKHSETNIQLYVWRSEKPEHRIVAVTAKNLKKADQNLIYSTIESNPIGQIKERLEKKKKEEEENKKVEQYFESLGCPENKSN